jgi:hypothetical protein
LFGHYILLSGVVTAPYTRLEMWLRC